MHRIRSTKRFALDIFPNYNMKTWVEEYKMLNGFHEWDIKVFDVVNKLKTICYIYGKYESLFHYMCFFHIHNFFLQSLNLIPYLRHPT